VADQKHTQSVRRKRIRRLRVSIGLAIAVLATGLAWEEHERIFQDIGAWWVVSDELAHADAIVVLGGSIDVRPFAAADLYQRGFADKILVANVQLSRAEVLGFVPSHTENNRSVLLQLGIPAAAVATFGKDVSSTQQEAAAVREWASSSHAKRIIVPTEIFAARRTRWIFKHELAPIGVEVIVHALPPQDYTLADWWRHRYGLIDFNNELIKYLYYRARY
jgi:uncharacterized SAM-binding protein YcdF (DUF218 family)